MNGSADFEVMVTTEEVELIRDALFKYQAMTPYEKARVASLVERLDKLMGAGRS